MRTNKTICGPIEGYFGRAPEELGSAKMFTA
jgi:hypothetical protein